MALNPEMIFESLPTESRTKLVVLTCVDFLVKQQNLLTFHSQEDFNRTQSHNIIVNMFSMQSKLIQHTKNQENLTNFQQKDNKQMPTPQ